MNRTGVTLHRALEKSSNGLRLLRGGGVCAEETWIRVYSQPQSTPSPFLLLLWGFGVWDSGSETNGFWLLGPETLPGKVVDGEYMALTRALGDRRGQGVWGASLLCLVVVHCRTLGLLLQDLAEPQPRPLHRLRWDGACGSLDTLDQSYRNAFFT